MAKRTIFSTGRSFKDYYQIINTQYLNIFKKYHMLHYPFFEEYGESLEQRQLNLTEFCITKVEGIEKEVVLDVGCGNGVQSIHFANRLNPGHMLAVDLNEDNIRLAQSLAKDRVHFQIDDAQQLNTIEDQSVDILFCIESAFHYPDKDAFLKQVHRVLRPEGVFLIADILSRSYKKRPIIGNWKKKMYYYHWIMQDYLDSFKKNRLELDHHTDITQHVIRGYSGFRFWISRKQFSNPLRHWVTLLFVSSQVWINVFLLKTRRHYMVFMGRRNAA